MVLGDGRCRECKPEFVVVAKAAVCAANRRRCGVGFCAEVRSLRKRRGRKSNVGFCRNIANE